MHCRLYEVAMETCGAPGELKTMGQEPRRNRLPQQDRGQPNMGVRGYLVPQRTTHSRNRSCNVQDHANAVQYRLQVLQEGEEEEVVVVPLIRTTTILRIRILPRTKKQRTAARRMVVVLDTGTYKGTSTSNTNNNTKKRRKGKAPTTMHISSSSRMMHRITITNTTPTTPTMMMHTNTIRTRTLPNCNRNRPRIKHTILELAAVLELRARPGFGEQARLNTLSRPPSVASTSTSTRIMRNHYTRMILQHLVVTAHS